jgi:hypothetical protein
MVQVIYESTRNRVNKQNTCLNHKKTRLLIKLQSKVQLVRFERIDAAMATTIDQILLTIELSIINSCL